jgi:AcrR family transcriptional regulator
MASPGGAPLELSRRERKKLAIRARLLEVAAELFDAHGFAATRVVEICERADVAQKTFFNHFTSKQELLRELARSALEQLLGDVEAARKRERTTAARLARFFAEVAERAETGGPMRRELVTELAHAVHAAQRGSEHARRLHDAFGALVRDGLAAGDVTRRHDPETLTQTILGAYYVLLFNYAHIDGFPVRRQAAALARLLADALAPSPEERAHGA